MLEIHFVLLMMLVILETAVLYSVIMADN